MVAYLWIMKSEMKDKSRQSEPIKSELDILNVLWKYSLKRSANGSSHSLNLYKKTVLAVCLVISGLCLSAFADKRKSEQEQFKKTDLLNGQTAMVRKNTLQVRSASTDFVDDTTKKFHLKLAPIKVIVPPVNVVVPPVKVKFAMSPLHVTVPPVNIKFAMAPLKMVVPPVNVNFTMAPLKFVVPPVNLKFKMKPLNFHLD
jgi:hypothetical protein